MAACKYPGCETGVCHYHSLVEALFHGLARPHTGLKCPPLGLRVLIQLPFVKEIFITSFGGDVVYNGIPF
jgi:hypothetical protein